MSSPEIKATTSTEKNDSKPVITSNETVEEHSTSENLQEQCPIDPVNTFQTSTMEDQEESENSNTISIEANQDEIENAAVDNSKNNVSCNPNLPEDEENEMLERLRGDAIGNTLYSERFVISTLLKLREIEEPLQTDKAFERDLEGLWDMTIENDVVLKLLELDVYEIFTQTIINYESDVRLIEILVGIIGNMCTVSEQARVQLRQSDMTTEILLQLISCGDTHVLIQLMRVITMVYANIEAALLWNNQIDACTEFFEQFCFMLRNSNNEILLNDALKTLYTILSKCASIEESYRNDFVAETSERNSAFFQVIANSNTVLSTIEAFQTFYAKEVTTSNEPDGFADTDTTSESLKKTFLVFINIHDIILNYMPQVYNQDSEIALCNCFNLILKTVATPNFLLLAHIDCLQDVVENLLPIYLTKNTLHNEESVFRIVILWNLLKTHIDALPNGTKEPTNDFDADESDELELNESFKELFDITKQLLNILLLNYKGSALTNIFKRCEAESALQVFIFFGVNISSYNKDHTEAYCTELETILHSCNRET